MLVATVEHRAWFKNILDFIKGDVETLQYQNVSVCHFEKLIYEYSDTFFKSVDAFNRISYLHRNIHDISEKMLGFYNNGENNDVLQSVIELESLHKEILKEMSLGLNA
jgi:hypothetical protein